MFQQGINFAKLFILCKYIGSTYKREWKHPNPA